MVHIASLPRLRFLFLEQTRVGDDGLGLLCNLPAIGHLSLCGTLVTDAGLAGVANKLNSGPCVNLLVSSSGVTQAGLKSVRAKLTHTQLYSEKVSFQTPRGSHRDQPRQRRR